MNTYTSDLDYIDREVLPALGDYADDFDMRSIFHRMVNYGGLEYMPQGWVKTDYHDGIFWQIVEELDMENAGEKPSYVFPTPDGLVVVTQCRKYAQTIALEENTDVIRETVKIARAVMCSLGHSSAVMDDHEATEDIYMVATSPSFFRGLTVSEPIRVWITS